MIVAPLLSLAMPAALAAEPAEAQPWLLTAVVAEDEEEEDEDEEEEEVEEEQDETAK